MCDTLPYIVADLPGVTMDSFDGLDKICTDEMGKTQHICIVLNKLPYRLTIDDALELLDKLEVMFY